MNRPLGSSSEPPKKKSDKNSPVGLIVAIVVIVVILLVVTDINKDSDSEATRPRVTSRPATTSRPVATPTPRPLRVKYEVTGTTYSADLTYRNETEGTEQNTEVLPWTLEFEAEDGQFLYVSAQSKFNGTADISCKITVNGTVIQSASSSGRFVIAQCDGRAER